MWFRDLITLTNSNSDIMTMVLQHLLKHSWKNRRKNPRKLLFASFWTIFYTSNSGKWLQLSNLFTFRCHEEIPWKFQASEAGCWASKEVALIMEKAHVAGLIWSMLKIHNFQAAEGFNNLTVSWWIIAGLRAVETHPVASLRRANVTCLGDGGASRPQNLWLRRWYENSWWDWTFPVKAIEERFGSMAFKKACISWTS